jgi:type I site-specific restriction endonuclease
VAEAWKRLAGPGGSRAGPDKRRRKTIVFAVDRQHAEALLAAFEAAGDSRARACLVRCP